MIKVSRGKWLISAMLALGVVGVAQVSQGTPLLTPAGAAQIRGGSGSCDYTWTASHLCSRTDACRDQNSNNCGGASCDGICQNVRQYYDTRTTWPWESDYQRSTVVCGLQKTGATCKQFGNKTNGFYCSCDGGTLGTENCSDQLRIDFGTCDGASTTTTTN